MSRKKTTKTKQLDSYTFPEVRTNNPKVGLVTPKTDPDLGIKKKYKFDPFLEPKLDWASKFEKSSIDIPIVSLHVHERIDPKTIIKNFKSFGDVEQPSIFDVNKPLQEDIAFYNHNDNWSNRLIAGDSLLVMNSLLEKEAMENSIQCIFIDPPFGIKYGSNFQPFVNKKEVKDQKDEDLTSEPEMVKAFRDTWELGIHSYLTYLRDRLFLARKLLTKSGSIFVQIGDENVHRVSLLLDEIFGFENRIATITYATTSTTTTSYIPEVENYLLWYCKDKKSSPKFNQLYEPFNRKEFLSRYSSIRVEENGKSRALTEKEKFDPDKYIPKGARLYQCRSIASTGSTDKGSRPYTNNDGKVIKCPTNYHWQVSLEGLKNLENKGLLEFSENSLYRKRYEDEFPGFLITNLWNTQMSEVRKSYVVQTSRKVIERCILMTTDPGDIVFDPTCGSGSTACVAEQWGRRWITCDTSRVALTLAKQRLMTANFDYYLLQDISLGVSGGFEYEKILHVTSKTLAYDEPESYTYLYDQPKIDKNITRITGPFTSEAVPAPYAVEMKNLNKKNENSITKNEETFNQNLWKDELKQTGIRGKNNQFINFNRIDISYGTKYIQAIGYTDNDLIALIVFGTRFEPLEQRRVELAIEEARKIEPKTDLILFAAFEFDPIAGKTIDEMNWPGINLLRVKINDDLLNRGLKKNRKSNQSFWLIGQPDVVVNPKNGGGNTKFL